MSNCVSLKSWNKGDLLLKEGEECRGGEGRKGKAGGARGRREEGGEGSGEDLHVYL